MSQDVFPFPGQVERMDLTFEQLEALSSIVCSEVFATFSFVEALSIREVAKELDKSPAAVGAHVSALADCGLIIAVGTRKRRSRTETLYAHKSKAAKMVLENQPWEYVELYLDRFRGAMRMAERQHEAFQRAIRVDPEYAPFGSYNWRSVWLSREQRDMFQDKLKALHEEILQASQTDPAEREQGEYVRMMIHSVFLPTTTESRRRLSEKGGARDEGESKALAMAQVE